VVSEPVAAAEAPKPERREGERRGGERRGGGRRNGRRDYEGVVGMGDHMPDFLTRSFKTS